MHFIRGDIAKIKLWSVTKNLLLFSAATVKLPNAEHKVTNKIRIFKKDR
jgi:hypothetical protein